jgi:hypothetical protein
MFPLSHKKIRSRAVKGVERDSDGIAIANEITMGMSRD